MLNERIISNALIKSHFAGGCWVAVDRPHGSYWLIDIPKRLLAWMMLFFSLRDCLAA